MPFARGRRLERPPMRSAEQQFVNDYDKSEHL